MHFPGQPALLYVYVQNTFEDTKDTHYLKQIYYFNNERKDTSSFINKIHVWEERNHRITLVLCFFHKDGCKLMQKAFPHTDENSKVNFHHHHDNNWCMLSVSGKENIQSFLNVISATQQFVSNAKNEMDKLQCRL